MASCPKCGKTSIPKRKPNPRTCPRCGVLATVHNLLRNGAPQ